MNSFPVRGGTSLIKQSSLAMGAIVAVMWVLELIDTLTGNALDRFGIEPRSIASLPEIFSAPWLHFGWGHLMSNTLPLFIFGVIILASGVRPFLWVSLITVVSSGVLVWLVSPDHTITLGASGVIFGYLTYILARAFFTKSWWQIGIALVVGLAYGGILWGVLPWTYGVSWQAHLGGAIGGVLAAWLLHRQLTPTNTAG